jgi:serine/threonine protein kinase
VLPENAYIGLDDVLRLGHLVLAIDQTSNRPKSRTTLLDYMSPEMLSVRPHNEHELALLADDSEDGDSSSDDGGGGDTVCGREGGRQQQQQEWEGLQEPGRQQQREVPRAQLGVLGASSSGLVPTTEGVLLLNTEEEDPGDSQHSHQQQQQQQRHQGSKQRAQLDPSRQASPDPAAHVQQVQSAFQAAAAAEMVEPAAAAATTLAQGDGRAAGRRGSKAFLGPCGGTGRAEWEYQDSYDEKVDIWQLGCMLHELLCGSMPFEVRAAVGLFWSS